MSPTQRKSARMPVRNQLLAQWPYFDRLSSSAQRTLVARSRAAIAPAPAPPQVAPQPPAAAPAAAPALTPFVIPANIRVNDPGEDVGFGNQTTQSEPSIAVHKRNVLVGYNDST